MQIQVAYTIYVTSHGLVEPPVKYGLPFMRSEEPFPTRKAAASASKQIETPYQTWRARKSSEPFPIASLTQDDIDIVTPKRDWKELFLKYWQILNSGKLPHGNTPPKKGRLFQHKSEIRLLPPLNEYLVTSNITPVHIFTEQNLSLRRLYSAYKEMTKQAGSSQFVLEERLTPAQLRQVTIYLDRNRETIDPDFHELTLIDPDFGEVVLSGNFLDRLFDLATKPDELPSAPSVALQASAPPIESQSNTSFAPVPNKPVYASGKLNGNGKIKLPETARIVNINCPLLDALNKKSKGQIQYKNGCRFPSQHDISIAYTNIGDPYIRQSLHKTFHNFNMKRIIDVELIYLDGRKESLTVSTAQCKRILEEIREQGFSYLNQI